MPRIAATLAITIGLSMGFAAPNAMGQDIGQDLGQNTPLLAQEKTPNPTYKRVNKDDGTGTFAPMLQVTQPNGDVSYIRIGEQGLTRSILFNSKELRAFGRKLTRQQRAAARKKG